MSQLRSLRWAVVVIALFACTAAVNANVPAVVKLVPDDAVVVATVPNLASLSTKAAILNQKLALNQPQLNSALGFVKAMFGLNRGINDQGGVALVITSLPIPNASGRASGPQKPKGLLLLPIRDYQEFLGNFGTQTASKLNEIRFMGQKLYVRQVSGYAVLSDNREQVAGFQPATAKGVAARSGSFGRQIFSHSDISFYVDMARLGRAMRPMIGPQLAIMKQQVKRFGGADPQAAKFLDAYLNIYSSIIESVLRDGDVIVSGLDVSNDGIGMSYVCKFREGSTLAKTFAENPSQTPTFNRVPDGPYVIAMTADFSTLPVKQWFADIPVSFADAGGFEHIFASGQKLIDASGDQWQSVMYAPNPGAPPLNLMNGLWVVSSEDPAGFVEAYHGYLNEINNIEMGGVAYHTVIEQNAIEVADHQVDQYVIKINAPNNGGGQFNPAAMMGDQNGAIFHVDDSVVVALNQDEAMLTRAIVATEGKGTLDGNAGINAVRRRLPRQYVGQFYVNIGPLLQTFARFNPTIAPAANRAANVPPIAAAAGIHDGSLGVRGFVPMRVITTIKNVVMSQMGGAARQFSQAR